MNGFIHTILSIFGGIIANAVTIYFQKENHMDWNYIVLVVYIILMIILGIFAFRYNKKISIDIERVSELNKIKNLHSILYNYISHQEQLRIISSEGKELIGGHIGNYDWKELTEWLCKNMDIKHLRYSNIGSEYHLVDIKEGKEYKIPTDNRLETKVETSGLKNGQILLLTENP